MLAKVLDSVYEVLKILDQTSNHRTSHLSYDRQIILLNIVVLRCSSAQDAQAVHHRNFRKMRQAKQIKSKIKRLILTPWSGSLAMG